MSNNHTTFFRNLTQFVGKSGMEFHDMRIAVTFLWAIVGLILSEKIHLSRWIAYRPGDILAASKERQLSRWLHNEHIRPMKVYIALAKKVIAELASETLYLALDTTMLWKRFAIVRLALVYRGRALPLGWVVVSSGSATVALSYYRRMLAQVAAIIPKGSKVVLLADRGFMDIKLMTCATQLGWSFRIRVKKNVMIHRATKGKKSVRALMPPKGEVRFFSHIWFTEQQFGPVHLALAHVRTPHGYQEWAIVSDEEVGLHTLDEYGLRFDIEENFLDDKSAGFQLEQTQLADSMAISRLCLILATATVYSVSTGTAVVEQGLRRFVDTHWQRGLSYFQIGRRWIQRAITCGSWLLNKLQLPSARDPEPVIASRRLAQKSWIAVSRIEFL